MPNTKSAERRMRSSARRHRRNVAVKTRLRRLEKQYLRLVGEGKRDDAAAALRVLTSAFDKAAKTGVIHDRKADRKKSRLTLRLQALKPN
jgi:small subunit ribosomal protein S20